ncbi:MAG: LysR family transcriptional regulator [Pseudomonadota bacterium]
MTKRLDRLSLLETFVRIAERGSISAAARDIGLSQASASRQLSDLETRLGMRLVHRTTHELSLTTDGVAVLARARSLLQDWNEMSDAVAGDGKLRGPLKIVAPVALGQLHLASAAVDFQLQYPDITIDLQLEDGEIRFAETGCDLWVRAGRPADDTLIHLPLAGVERLVAASSTLVGRQRFRSPEDIAALTMVSLTPFEGEDIPLTRKKGPTRMVKGKSCLTTNNIFAALTAVRQGIGYAVLPKWLITEDLESGQLIDLLPEWRAPSLPITAAYRAGGYQPRRLKAFLDHLILAIAKTPGLQPITQQGSV